MDHLRVMWNGVQKVNISSNCFKVMKTTFDMGPEILKWFLIPFSNNILNLINRYPRDSIETQCPYTNLAHVNLFHNVNVGISVRWFIPSEFELWKKQGWKYVEPASWRKKIWKNYSKQFDSEVSIPSRSVLHMKISPRYPNHMRKYFRMRIRKKNLVTLLILQCKIVGTHPKRLKREELVKTQKGGLPVVNVVITWQYPHLGCCWAAVPRLPMDE